MKKLVIISLFLSCFSVFAQGDRIDSLLNDLIYNDSALVEILFKPVKYDFIYTGASFNNKTFYAGRETGTDMINVSGYLYYFSHLGLFAGASGLWYDQLTPGYTSTTLTLGYGHYLDKKHLFRLKGSYSRYIYNNSDTITTYPYENNANLNFSFKKKWFGTRISANYSFGKEENISFTPTVYSSFYFWKFGKNNKFYFGPEVSCYFSSETINSSTDPEEVFGLLNTQLYTPLSINFGNLELQFAYYLNFPITQDTEYSYSVASSYSVSVFYLIPIAVSK